MQKTDKWKRLIALATASVLVIALTACGGQKTDESNGQNVNSEGGSRQAANEGYVYVPEFIELTSADEDTNINQPQLRGEDLYFQSYYWDEASETGRYRFYRQNLQTGETVELPLAFDFGENENYYPMGGLIFDKDGNMTCLMNASTYEEEDYSNAYWLYQFDTDGNQLKKQDITEALKVEGSDYAYVQQAVMDGEGKLYAVLSGEQKCFIIVLDAEGKAIAQIDPNTDWINSIGVVGENTVLVTRYSNTGAGMECMEVDVAGKTLGKAHSGMPSSYNSNSLNPTPDGGLLVNDGSKLWQYDLETESAKEILTWTDCNINGSYIQMIQAMEDGRIAVLSENWNNNTKEIAYLTKTDAAEVKQKQTITVATLWSNQDLQEAVVNFNKQSDTYQVRIETYYDENSEWTENKYQDSITALNNAITSSNCPDIIDLSYGNVNSYVSKGLLVDLAPYLESSSTVKREDLVESVLQAYTYGDTLICIPDSFSISTIMGRTSQLGDRTSWTIKDIMEFAKQYPESKLFYYSSKSQILSTCLQFSSDAFIDYSTGKCNFDSQEFIDILEFANMFETEWTYDEGESFPKKIASGKVLLNDVSFYQMTELQMYYLMFNEPVTFIGYPTVDGSSGNRIQGQNCYAITTKCSNPDGAWAFIETMLQYEPQPEWGGGNFSIRKDMLEECFAEAMKENVATDENGDPILDENGEPQAYPKTTWGYDDWEAEIYAATPEQVQAVRDLIDSAVAATNNDQTILQMIVEEAEGYFEGQKSAQEVASIIQSRVQIYVSENS